MQQNEFGFYFGTLDQNGRRHGLGYTVSLKEVTVQLFFENEPVVPSILMKVKIKNKMNVVNQLITPDIQLRNATWYERNFIKFVLTGR